jgi:hypothetical protein
MKEAIGRLSGIFESCAVRFRITVQGQGKSLLFGLQCLYEVCCCWSVVMAGCLRSETSLAPVVKIYMISNRTGRVF